MKLNDLTGKVALVTGATSGIGKETAVGLAKLGATVVVLGRSAARCQEAIADIKTESGSDSVDFVVADLTSQAQIRQAATDFLAKYDHLHILVNNAGVVPKEFGTTEDGFERMFAVNHLAYFLLTNLLLDTLKASAPSRIVSVASDAHRMVPAIDFDNLQCEKFSYAKTRDILKIYGQTKLMNIHFTKILAEKLAGTGVTANCLHPGFIGTNIDRQGGKWLRFIVSMLSKNVAYGAKTSLYLAASPEVEEVSGEYYNDKQALTASEADSNDRAVSEKLWHLSADMTGITV